MQTPIPLVPMNGSKVSGRELRRRLNSESHYVAGQLAPAVNQLLHNEQVTQQAMIALVERIDALEAVRPRRFWQRMAWLIRGV